MAWLGGGPVGILIGGTAGIIRAKDRSDAPLGWERAAYLLLVAGGAVRIGSVAG